MTSSYTSALRSATQTKSCRSCSGLKSASQGFIQNKLLINDLKTEFIVIVSPQQEGKFTIPGIRVGDSLILPTNQVHNLGIVFKEHLNMQAEINSICHSVYLHLCNIGQVCSVLSQEVTQRLIHAFITSYVDCCNTLLDKVSQSLTDKLQWILNSAARILILAYTQVAHMTPVCRELYWLPVSGRVDYKTLVLMYTALHSLNPQFAAVGTSLAALSTLGTAVCCVCRRQDSGHMEMYRTFPHPAPILWNLLPPAAHIPSFIQDQT